MKDLFDLGKLAIVLVLGIFVLTGCGVSGDTKPAAVQTNDSALNSSPAAAERGTKIGQIAPDFEMETAAGGKVSFKDLAGNPAVLVFWTAWCPVCKEEAPHVNKLAAEFEPKGVKVVGINIGESDARIAEGIKEFGIKYPVAKDKDTTVSKNYKVVGTPTVVFLDEKGAVRYFGNELPKDYAEKLNSMLGG